ncbi:NnrS family protein [Pikeienuella sp. HZG-20]|uniref:NnrS family protein n=1 Tax=Paludibacillus litoralis TaxID=3133267 RepID=UPI0030EDB75D
MTTSAEKMRAWSGPAILGFAIRPFFLLGAIWAALAMALWAAMLSGRDVLATAFDPVSWHAHEFIFGYLGAVLAGFLLTMTPNWTGRLPVVGWPLAGLVSLWLAGRGAVAASQFAPWGLVMAVDLAFPVVLVAALLREVVAGRAWTSLPVLGLAAGMILGNALFHLAAARGGDPAGGAGLRLGVGVAVMLISLVGGRIIPSFTRNWLARRGGRDLPAPHGRADAAVLGLTLAALAVWVARPEHPAIVAVFPLAAAAQGWRLSRWAGRRARAEPLILALHAGYAFAPLGFLAVAAGRLAPGMAPAALHVWMAGAVGLTTLAVMTRAGLRHAGRPLRASRPIAALYGALIVSVLARLGAGAFPAQGWLTYLAAAAWIAAFGGFAALFWPILARPRRARPGRE